MDRPTLNDVISFVTAFLWAMALLVGFWASVTLVLLLAG